MACVRPVKTILAYLFLLACREAVAAARLLWEERACAGVVRLANGSAQLLERCHTRARVAAPVNARLERQRAEGRGCASRANETPQRCFVRQDGFPRLPFMPPILTLVPLAPLRDEDA